MFYDILVRARCACPRVAAASPERPGRVIAKPYEVSTGSKPSVIVGGGMGHAPVVLACMAGRAVQLYSSIDVNRRTFWSVEGRPPRCE